MPIAQAFTDLRVSARRCAKRSRHIVNLSSRLLLAVACLSTKKASVVFCLLCLSWCILGCVVLLVGR